MARGFHEGGEKHIASENVENKDSRREKSELPGHFDNETGKLKPNEHYEANKYEYDTDKQGRIRRVEGTLRLDKETKANPAQQRAAGGEDRRTKADAREPDENGKKPVDDGGHYIGRRFGGSEKLDNLFAQDSHFNRSDYKKMENEFEGKINDNYQVEVRIDPKYHGDSERPEKVFVRAKYTDSDGNVERKIYMFKNEPDTRTRIRESKEDN